MSLVLFVLSYSIFSSHRDDNKYKT